MSNRLTQTYSLVMDVRLGQSDWGQWNLGPGHGGKCGSGGNPHSRPHQPQIQQIFFRCYVRENLKLVNQAQMTLKYCCQRVVHVSQLCSATGYEQIPGAPKSPSHLGAGCLGPSIPRSNVYPRALVWPSPTPPTHHGWGTAAPQPPRNRGTGGKLGASPSACSRDVERH